MRYYSANYCECNNNFVIQNIETDNILSSYSDVICVLKNLFQRSSYVNPSNNLLRRLNAVYVDDKITLYNPSQELDWTYYFQKMNRQKANILSQMYSQITKLLGEFNYCKNLFLPCVSIDSITDINDSDFMFDFYFPQARLGIFVTQSSADCEKLASITQRLADYDIAVISIPSDEIKASTRVFKNCAGQVNDRLLRFTDELNKYNNFNIDYSKYKNALFLTAVMRLQFLVLSLLEAGTISYNDLAWNFVIKCDQVADFAETALDDLFEWLQSLFAIKGLELANPKINITYVNSPDEFIKKPSVINVDINLFNLWDSSNEDNQYVYYIRNDFFETISANAYDKKLKAKYKNYFTVSTNQFIKYNVIIDEKRNAENGIKFLLSNIFKLQDFRESQLHIISNLLSGHDAIAALPRYNGKSFCSYFISMLQPMLSIIVCPTEAMVLDTIYTYNKNGFETVTAVFNNDEQNIVNACGNVINKKSNVLVVTPRLFENPIFINLLEEISYNTGIAYVVLEEAQMISEYSYDFSISYNNAAAIIRDNTVDAKFFALTSTASQEVCDDLVDILCIDEQSVIAKNAEYDDNYTLNIERLSASEPSNKIEHIENVIKRIYSFKNYRGKGLIYCSNSQNTNNNTDSKSISRMLVVGCGLKSKQYYEPSSPAERYSLHKNFEEMVDDKLDILSTTDDFSYGVKNTGIDYIIHTNLPKSPQELYQRIMRAHDNVNSNNYLFFTPATLSEKYMDKLCNKSCDLQEFENIIDFNDNDDFSLICMDVINELKNKEAEKQFFNFIREQLLKRISKRVIEYIDSKNNTVIERCLYKLKKLGMIEKYEIELINDNFMNGSEYASKYTIHINTFKKISVEKNMFSYIEQFIPDFDINNKNIAAYEKLRQIYYSDSENIFRYFDLLVEWSYDYFIRKKFILAMEVYKICLSDNPAKQLKLSLKNELCFSKKQNDFYNLFYENSQYESWIGILKNDNQIAENELLYKIKLRLERYSEFNYKNTGVNLSYGLLKIILNLFNEDEYDDRLNESFVVISKMGQAINEDLFSSLMQIAKPLSLKQKNEISKYLCEHYYDKLSFINEQLQDEISTGLLFVSSFNNFLKAGALFNAKCRKNK